MSYLTDIIRSDLSVVAADMDNPVFTWQGDDYACIAGSTNSLLTLGFGGFERGADLVLIVDRSLFADGNLPDPQQTLIYKTRTYRVMRVVLDPMSAVVKLVCVSYTKGI
jgi:hypothetical protein